MEILFVTSMSVAQAATLLNAIVIFLQMTISLSIVVLLMRFMPKSSTALSWSSISRILHSSLWPAILRTDSNSSLSSGWIVATAAHLSTFITILVAFGGIVLPLGLKPGPLVASEYYESVTSGEYARDNSVLGTFSTAGNRERYEYKRVGECGRVPKTDRDPTICSLDIPDPLLEIFNSTPYGPFSMQYRRLQPSYDIRLQPAGSVQSLFSRDNLFAVEGLVVDMTPENPGIGFRNHTVPTSDHGATWTEDLLWLEPQTSCVQTNFTLGAANMPSQRHYYRMRWDITYHGDMTAFENRPPLVWPLEGDDINLEGMARSMAIVNNQYIWGSIYNNTDQHGNLGMTRSFLGYDLLPFLKLEDASVLQSSPMISLPARYILPDDLRHIFGEKRPPLDLLCTWKFGFTILLNSSYIGQACGMFATLQDKETIAVGGAFNLTTCSSVTRASMQRVTFSTNSSHPDIESLHIVSRVPVNDSVLWAITKEDTSIGIYMNPFWGRISDQYEQDSRLWTIRSDGIYLPWPGIAPNQPFGLPDAWLPGGNPASSPFYVWSMLYSQSDIAGEYFLGGHWPLSNKIKELIREDSDIGQAKTLNLVWTDIMANNLVGSHKSDNFLANKFRPSLQYDLHYAIPAFILLAIWIPSFIISIGLLISRSLTLQYMRKVLNHTSVGRVVTGTSALRPEADSNEPYHRSSSYDSFSNVPLMSTDTLIGSVPKSNKEDGSRGKKRRWAKDGGKTRVILDLSTIQCQEISKV